jgi:hypothetical protein
MLEIGRGNPYPFLAGDRTGTSCYIPFFYREKVRFCLLYNYRLILMLLPCLVKVKLYEACSAFNTCTMFSFSKVAVNL